MTIYEDPACEGKTSCALMSISLYILALDVVCSLTHPDAIGNQSLVTAGMRSRAVVT